MVQVNHSTQKQSCRNYRIQVSGSICCCITISYVAQILLKFGVFIPRVTSLLGSLRTSPHASLLVSVAGFCKGRMHIVRLGLEVTPAGEKALVDAFFMAHPSALQISGCCCTGAETAVGAAGEGDGGGVAGQ